MVLPSPLTPDYRWNPAAGATGRYIDRRGRFVPTADVTREMERVIDGTRQEMRDLAKRLQAGDIGLQEWYDGMRGKMKIIHTLSGAVAKGGWQQMTPADWGAVGQISRQQYGYLNNFAQEILSGKQALDGRFLVRAGMYADAARGTGRDIERRTAASRGGDVFERRNLGIADHCTSRGGQVGCIEQADIGWLPVGRHRRIGDSPCGPHCHCYFTFGQMIDGEIVEIE